MDASPTHNMMTAQLPAEKSSIEAILQAMESAVTSDGLLHIANCIEANLSEALADPHQTEEGNQYIIDLHEIMDEVRQRYAQTRENEITLETNRLRDRLNTWGVTQKQDVHFTPVKSKKANKNRKTTEAQAAKKPRTEEASCSNRFSNLTIEEHNMDADSDVEEITPMPSPLKEKTPPENRWRRRAMTSTPLQEAQAKAAPVVSLEEFPPLPSKPDTRRKQPKIAEPILEDPFSVLKSEKCQTLYRELQQFVKIAETIPTKAGRMAALFKFIEEEKED
ncbi:hypothetical protein NPIL_266721 [Nephila pilipes]|uniref:Uncharacterized protein n=1 Tax=Nephila pilipes TaxID=299642 RepID=A0A8X6UBF2_NEPPI|nr:hypothetical protein NPIL_266721 [Nephila pilipes]